MQDEKEKKVFDSNVPSDVAKSKGGIAQENVQSSSNQQIRQPDPKDDSKQSAPDLQTVRFTTHASYHIHSCLHP
jgi:hypothetical protein